MEIKISDIVVPINGRDEGMRFVVIGREGEYALLADGKGRRVEKPKRKKVRHIRFLSKLEGRVADKLQSAERIQNSELRRALSEIGEESVSGSKGEGKAVSGFVTEKREVCTIAKRRHD